MNINDYHDIQSHVRGTYRPCWQELETPTVPDELAPSSRRWK